MKKLRRLGDITADMEKLLIEMTSGHDMQWHEIRALVMAWLAVHAPEQREEYVKDGSHPEDHYGYPRGKK